MYWLEGGREIVCTYCWERIFQDIARLKTYLKEREGGREGGRGRERESVCVCERERERGSGRTWKGKI